MAKRKLRSCLHCEGKVTEEEYQSDVCKHCGKKFSALERREAARLKRLANATKKPKPKPKPKTKSPDQLRNEMYEKAMKEGIYDVNTTTTMVGGWGDRIVSFIIMTAIVLGIMSYCSMNSTPSNNANAQKSEYMRKCMSNGTYESKCEDQWDYIKKY